MTRTRTASGLTAALTGVLLLALAGCAEPNPPGASVATTPSSTPASSPSASSTLSGSITVDAAASLNKVFPKLAEQFQAEHPGTKITFNFGGSSTLAAAIVAGAPIDVFAAASKKTMQTVQDAKLTAADPVAVARNQLEIAVPKGNPAKITGLKDFADAKKTIVVCDKEVPCGAAAQQVFDIAKITAKPDSTEPDVTSVLTKVSSDEADAGLVYVTDVQAAGGKVQGIKFPESDQAIVDVVVAPLTGSSNGELAAAWVQYVSQHEDALQDAGFLPPQ